MPDVQYFTGTKKAISGAAEPVKYFLTAGFVPAIVSLPPEQDSTTAPNGADIAGRGSWWAITRRPQCASGETPALFTAQLQHHRRDFRTQEHQGSTPGLFSQ